MKHEYITHQDCKDPLCGICKGGLLVCQACRGVAGSLSSECPGYRIKPGSLEKINEGRLDYREGRFVELPLERR